MCYIGLWYDGAFINVAQERQYYYHKILCTLLQSLYFMVEVPVNLLTSNSKIWVCQTTLLQIF